MHPLYLESTTGQPSRRPRSHYNVCSEPSGAMDHSLNRLMSSTMSHPASHLNRAAPVPNVALRSWRALGEYLRPAHTKHSFCSQYTRDVLIFPPPEMALSGEQTHWPQKVCKHPSFPGT